MSTLDCTNGLYAFQVTSIFIGGGLIGSLLAQKIIDPRGRRAGVQLATAGYLIGSLVLAVADSVNILIVGRSAISHFIEIFHSSLSRFFKGLAAGLGLCVIPPFLSEISPPKVRGTVGKPDPEDIRLTEHKQYEQVSSTNLGL